MSDQQVPRELLVSVRTARNDRESAIVRLDDIEKIERFRQNHRARVCCDQFVEGDVAGHRSADSPHPHMLTVMIYGAAQPAKCIRGFMELMERQIAAVIDPLPADSLIRQAIERGEQEATERFGVSDEYHERDDG